MTPSDDVLLKIDGLALGGWMDIRIGRGVERLPSDFEIRMTERFPESIDAMQVKAGQACELWIGADRVITGYVDRVVPSIQGRQHSIAVLGRGKCQDLVDCSAEWPGGQISGASVLEVARKLAAPYGISVTALTDPGAPIPQFNLMRGETPFEIIERICRFRQLLAYDSTDGGLVLSRVGSTRAASGFMEGVNVLHAASAFGVDQRFSEYRGYLQSVETLSDLGGEGDLIATFKDAGVKRHRVRMLVAESSGGGIGQQVAIDRIQWEAARRWGRSHQVRLTTDSWRDAAGKLYTPNTLAPLDLPALKIQGQIWVIGEVAYRKGSGGTECDVVLMPEAAFIPRPELMFQVPAEVAMLPDNLGRK